MKTSTKHIVLLATLLMILLIALNMGMSTDRKIYLRQIGDKSVNQIQNLKVKSLPEHNVFIIDPSNPSFDGLFDSLVSIPSDMTKSVKQFSIFISNMSDRAIAAYAVKWEFLQSNGKIISDKREYFQLKPTSSDTNPALRPHSSRLISLINGVVVNRYPAKLITDFPQFPENERPEIKDALINEISELNKKLVKSVGWSVTLDGVLFTDGTFVGPDTIGYFDRIKARSDARQDILQEISDIVAQANESSAQAYTNAFRHAEEVLGSGVPRFSGFNTTDFYKRSKAQTAQEILTRRNKLGDQEAIDFVKNELSKPRMRLIKQK